MTPTPTPDPESDPESAPDPEIDVERPPGFDPEAAGGAVYSDPGRLEYISRFDLYAVVELDRGRPLRVIGTFTDYGRADDWADERLGSFDVVPFEITTAGDVDMGADPDTDADVDAGRVRPVPPARASRLRAWAGVDFSWRRRRAR